VAGAVASTDHFGLTLCGQAGRPKENLVCSPASAAVALTMTMAGARGETQAQMARVLRLEPAGLDAAHGSFGKLLATLNGKDGQDGLALHVADRIWGQAELKPTAQFLAVLSEHYNSPFTPVDFASHTEAARGAINRWGAAETRERIQETLSPGSVDPLTKLVLTNAVYFKGRWLRSFDPRLTSERPFRGTGAVKMMSTIDTFAHARVGDVQIVQIPYAGRMSMVVILPDAPDGLPAVEARSATSYDDWIEKLRPQLVDLELPRWKLTAQLSLDDLLKKMGMSLAFTSAADFSAIGDDVYIAKVLQQAFIDVNEEGTEAAAVTAVIMGEESADPRRPPPPIVFHADHPFLYLIRDDTTGVILFAGRVVAPS
jgi:serpin B